MGWDAYAIKDGKDIEVDYSTGEPIVIDGDLRKAFADAFAAASYEDGVGHAPLSQGSVFGLMIANVMQDVTGYTTRGNDWTPEMVKDAAECEWDIKMRMDHEERHATIVAKHFVQCCAKHGLGITFSC